MHLVLFLGLGCGLSIGLCKILGMYRFQRHMMLTLALVEQVATILLLCYRWAMHPDDEPELTQFFTHRAHSVLLAGGDVDIAAMSLLAVIWYCFHQGEYPVLVTLCMLFPGSSVTLFGIAMFETMRQPSGRYENRAPKACILEGGVVTIVQLPIWAYYTYRTVVETPETMIEGIFEKFNVDVLHLHHFTMIFILGWYLFPIICSIQEDQVFSWSDNVSPRTRRWITRCCKLALTLLFFGNIAAAQWFLWYVFATSATRSSRVHVS